MAIISLTRATAYQTMKGWEGACQIAQDPGIEGSASYPLYQDDMIRTLVDFLGISRVRLEMRSGNEFTTDWYSQYPDTIDYNTYRSHWYATINDNANPNAFLGGSADGGGWQWSHLDAKIEEIVLPMRAWCAARGESLWVTLNVTDDDDPTKRVGGDTDYNASPSEYAESVLAAFQHIEANYGFFPDALAIVNEPNVNSWSGANVGDALEAAKARLTAAGYTNVVYIGPSSDSMAAAATDLTGMIGAGGTPDVYDTHYYQTRNQTLRLAIASDAAAIGALVHMGEYMNLDVDMIYDLLTEANASSIQQFALGYHTGDDGTHYIDINDSVVYDPKLTLGATAKLFRSYFCWVRPEAERFLASSDNGNFKPLAWENPDGTYVVVVRAAASGIIQVDDLPDATYGINYSTDAGSFNNYLADQVISGGGSVSFSMPAAGIATIFGRRHFDNSAANSANTDVQATHQVSNVNTTVYTRQTVQTTVYVDVVMV